MSFDYDEVKKGKRVSAIRFRLNDIRAQNLFENTERNDQIDDHVRETLKVFLTSETSETPDTPSVSEPIFNENDLPKSLILEQLKPTVCKKFGVTPKMLKKLIDDFPVETLRKAMVLTEKAMENGKITGSAAGFFVEATRQNYAPPAPKGEYASRSLLGVGGERQAEMRQKAKELALAEKQEKQAREAVKKQEFEQERDAILTELKTDNALRNAVVQRIKYSLFYLSYDAEKTFEDNLENPSFLAAVLNFFKMIKNEG